MLLPTDVRSTHSLRHGCLAAVLLFTVAGLFTATPAHAQPLRVMTFNVRLPLDQDGANRWEARRDLVVEMLRKLSPNEIVILVGDFNDTPESRTHAALTTTLTDALAASPKRSGPDATFHGFTGEADRRIDWILFRGLRVMQVRTVTTHRDGRYPSDHFPVLADFEVADAPVLPLER